MSSDDPLAGDVGMGERGLELGAGVGVAAGVAVAAWVAVEAQAPQIDAGVDREDAPCRQALESREPAGGADIARGPHGVLVRSLAEVREHLAGARVNPGSGA